MIPKSAPHVGNEGSIRIRPQLVGRRGFGNTAGRNRAIRTTWDVPSLKLTAQAPVNGWLEYDPFLLGFGLFSGAKMLFSGRV